jgi:hypothetical protein
VKRTHRLPTGAIALALLMLPGCDLDLSPVGVVLTELFRGCATVRTYSVGQTANGTLGEGSCLAAEYILVDYYEMRISSQRSVTLTMRSAQMDAYLRVWKRDTGALVASDDDSGGGLDARLTHDFPAGTYVIGATTVSAGQTGSYTLSSN